MTGGRGRRGSLAKRGRGRGRGRDREATETTTHDSDSSIGETRKDQVMFTATNDLYVKSLFFIHYI